MANRDSASTSAQRLTSLAALAALLAVPYTASAQQKPAPPADLAAEVALLKRQAQALDWQMKDIEKVTNLCLKNSTTYSFFRKRVENQLLVPSRKGREFLSQIVATNEQAVKDLGTGLKVAGGDACSGAAGETTQVADTKQPILNKAVDDTTRLEKELLAIHIESNLPANTKQVAEIMHCGNPGNAKAADRIGKAKAASEAVLATQGRIRTHLTRQAAELAAWRSIASANGKACGSQITAATGQ